MVPNLIHLPLVQAVGTESSKECFSEKQMVVKNAESGLAINWILALLRATWASLGMVLIGVFQIKERPNGPYITRPQDAAVLTLD